MKHENGTFTLTKNELRAVMAFASTDTTRAHLNGVAFDPEHGSVVATDGHTLIRCNGMATERAPLYVVPLAMLKQAYKLLSKASYTLGVSAYTGPDGRTIVSLAAKDGESVIGQIVTTLDPDACPFPPYQQVIPGPGISDDARDCGVGANGEYLARLALVGKATGSRAPGVKLVTLHGALDPLVFRASGPELSAEVVIMPMRI